MLQHFLSIADSDRIAAVLRRLTRHNVDTWALTGGLALGIHSVTRGVPTERALNDLDFVCARFEDIPETLAAEFLFRHVHPHETPGRTMMQLVDVGSRIRIDVFLSAGATLSRAHRVELREGRFLVIAIEDLIARTARLLLDLTHGVMAPAKHADDFPLLSEILKPDDVQEAWADHRRPGQPAKFAEVSELVQM
jgi:hypothetical protein